jgi:ABC-type phosphate/phosphonate transport system substrate-binding protein
VKQSATSRMYTPILAAAFAALTNLGAASTAGAAEYTLVVQPVQSPETTATAFQPLADYLSKATGEKIELVTALNFLTYWETMKKGDQYDLILDAAHFTDYRIKRLNYIPLVKVASVVSFSLVTRDDHAVLDTRELIGKRLAVLPSPSMGYVRLNQIFPNPLRQPVIVPVNNAEKAAELVKDGKADAAMIPSPMVGSRPYLYTVQTTAQVPHMALSASPRVPEVVRKAIRDALLSAPKTPAGRKLLANLNLGADFEPATVDVYAGYSRLLTGVYGYHPLR